MTKEMIQFFNMLCDQNPQITLSGTRKVILGATDEDIYKWIPSLVGKGDVIRFRESIDVFVNETNDDDWLLSEVLGGD